MNYFHLFIRTAPLYFSSDGHVGMGGLDIFKATFDSENNLRFIDNMNSPINSCNDDFGIIFEDNEERGYLSSNRIGSKGDDIYRFNLPKLNITLSGVVTDFKTKQIITSATISLEGSDGSSYQINTDNSGRYFFDKDLIKENVTYQLNVSSDGYLSTNFTQSTIGIKQSLNLVQDIILEATLKEIVLPKLSTIIIVHS